jgi:alkanesulfonate monooxygenase SsuD/methylene tetrahydromethanopterin reductase-like flavin-dependent oxidoreductase (luciferase family)
VDFEQAKSYPQPVQPKGIPIAVGGHTQAAAQRAGRLGDEFFPAVGRPDQLEDLIDILRTAARDAGRDPDSIGITAAAPSDAEGVTRLADLGVSRVVIPNLGGGPERWKSRLGGFAERVISKVR